MDVVLRERNIEEYRTIIGNEVDEIKNLQNLLKEKRFFTSMRLPTVEELPKSSTISFRL